MMSITVPILLYHSVCDRPVAGQEGFTVTPAVFREHVCAISDAGRAPLTISELATALRTERGLPPRPVLVTFDDGFADVRPAVELLLGAGLAATVFVTSGWVGREGMLTPGGLRELNKLDERVELGAHSVTHPRLDELRTAQATEEIADSKAALESVLEAPLRSFSYPHGAYDTRVRAAVIDAGFSVAAAVKNALSHERDDVFALARMTVMSDTSAARIGTLLNGSGAPLAWGEERLRTRCFRSYRRFCRRVGRVVA
jgi:peptidoglycan/xylan/chitin deacetylase (PgdA/CDA1 family)